jgi:hypothetical protein
MKRQVLWRGCEAQLAGVLLPLWVAPRVAVTLSSLSFRLRFENLITVSVTGTTSSGESAASMFRVGESSVSSWGYVVAFVSTGICCTGPSPELPYGIHKCYTIHWSGRKERMELVGDKTRENTKERAYR